MDLSKIPAGKNIPDQINVIIEVPMNNDPVKYEFDKDSGAIFVDRFIQASMRYPANYGFVPHTLSDDGDPADVLVVSDFPVVPGAIIPARPIGVLIMEDESGMDEKILAVPLEKIHPFYADVKSYKDLPEIFIEKISHFFEYYKKLEKNKWVKITGWEGPERAKEIIQKAVENYKK